MDSESGGGGKTLMVSGMAASSCCSFLVFLAFVLWYFFDPKSFPFTSLLNSIFGTKSDVTQNVNPNPDPPNTNTNTTTAIAGGGTTAAPDGSIEWKCLQSFSNNGDYVMVGRDKGTGAISCSGQSNQCDWLKTPCTSITTGWKGGPVCTADGAKVEGWCQDALNLFNGSSNVYGIKSPFKLDVPSDDKLLVWSGNNQYKLTWQKDGNLVVYDTTGKANGVGTSGSGKSLSFQDDGNLVVYGGANNAEAKWAFYTSKQEPKGNYVLTLSNDGKVVIKDSSGRKI